MNQSVFPYKQHPDLVYAVIQSSGPGNPRNDTASVSRLGAGLIVVWHAYPNPGCKYRATTRGSSDFGRSDIASKQSHDGGRSWDPGRLLVEADQADNNVQAPALRRLRNGDLLLICLRGHAGGESSSMCLFRSKDDGNTFRPEGTVWSHSPGQWLQGGASSLLELHSGRRLIPYHGGTGHQGSQHNVVRCALGDDGGLTWQHSQGVVDLPMRGAMEASVAELQDGELIISTVCTTRPIITTACGLEEKDSLFMTQTTQAQPSPQEIRAQLNAYIMGTQGSTEPVHQVQDSRIPGPGGDLPLRIYLPQGNGPFPVLVFIHGAGWVAGNLDTHDNVCRYLCNRVPCTVVSVDYRLAPESKFPAALDDAYAATVWAADHARQLDGDGDRLAVAGDSSGANLAAAVCLIARDRKGPPIRFQLLVNPALDMTAYDAPGFENMKWFREQYVNGKQDHTRPHASPVFAGDLSGLPQAFIITGEHDGLREEAQRYAARLGEAGVFVNDYCQRGMGHLSAMYARATPDAQEALDLSVVALRAALKAAPDET